MSATRRACFFTQVDKIAHEAYFALFLAKNANSMQYKTKLTLKIFWQHVSKYKLAVFGLLSLVFIGSAANMTGPYLYKFFFDELASDTPTELKIAKMKIIIVWVLVIYMFDWVVWRASAFVNSWLQTKMMADLANTCFNYMHKHSVVFLKTILSALLQNA